MRKDQAMLRRSLLVVLASLGASGSSLAQISTPTGIVPSRRSLERLGLEKHWMSIVPLGQGEQLKLFNVANSVLVSDKRPMDGQLFAQTDRGHLHAFDAETGRYQWGAHLDSSNGNPLPVSVNSDQVFVTVLKTLYALDRKTGRPLWKVQVDGIPSTGTICDEETVAVGTNSGKLVTYSVRDHSKDPTPGLSAGSFSWAWQSGAKLVSRPVVTPHLVTFASQDHRVYTALKSEGENRKSQLLYRFLTSGPINASLATHGNRTLVVASEDHNVYGIDLFTADVRFIVSTGAPIDQEPLVSGDDIVVINIDGRLFRINGRTREVVWEKQTDGHRILMLSPKRIYLVNPHHDLSIIDRATGQVVHNSRETYETAGLDNRELKLAFPNYYDDRLIIGSANGFLFCVREAGSLTPTLLRALGTPPFGTIPPQGLVEESSGPAVVTPEPADATPGDNVAPEPEPDN